MATKYDILSVLCGDFKRSTAFIFILSGKGAAFKIPKNRYILVQGIDKKQKNAKIELTV
jgi:hypothetical protein